MAKGFIGVAAGGAIAFGLITHAAAQPPQAEEIELSCDNGNTYTIWTNGHGAWTPGHIVGDSGVLIPLSFEFTFTPEVGDPETETVAKGNGSAAQGNKELVTCEFGETIPGEGTFDGVVVGFIPGNF